MKCGNIGNTDSICGRSYIHILDHSYCGHLTLVRKHDAIFYFTLRILYFWRRFKHPQTSLYSMSHTLLCVGCHIFSIINIWDLQVEVIWQPGFCNGCVTIILSKPKLNPNSTQPQHNMTLHITPPTQKLNVSNISAVTDLILMTLYR